MGVILIVLVLLLVLVLDGTPAEPGLAMGVIGSAARTPFNAEAQEAQSTQRGDDGSESLCDLRALRAFALNSLDINLPTEVVLMFDRANGSVMSTLLIATASCVAALAWAQEPNEPQQRASPADQDTLKQLATPGEHHERLGPLAGKWKLAVKWRGGPAHKWTQSQGTAEYQWILGRRFLQESFQYDMGAESLEWLGVYGYDNYQKQYTAVWVDNMGTNTEFASAQYDAAARSFTFLGEQDDPPTKGKRKFKWIITLDGPDRLRFESYDQRPPGTYYKNTEIIATRQTK